MHPRDRLLPVEQMHRPVDPEPEPALNRNSYRLMRVTGVMSNWSCLMLLAATVMVGASGGAAPATEAKANASRQWT